MSKKSVHQLVEELQKELDADPVTIQDKTMSLDLEKLMKNKERQIMNLLLSDGDNHDG